jgi:outer membrane protein assembly factor BamE (lipoprotein component of BamABCDE complex)
MGQTIRAIKLGLCALALLAVAACSNIDRKHGYVPLDEDLEQIVVGVDTKDTVAEAIGRPTTAGILSEGGWYYVKSSFRAYGLREPKEIDREVVAISFDGDGVVENIERFGLEDGRVVAISRRVTDSNIKGVSFLRQLFGSIGNFTAEKLLQR